MSRHYFAIMPKLSTIPHKVLNYLGFDVANHKIVSPAQQVVYLGIHINTTTMEYSLPADKLAKLLPTLRKFLEKDRATKVELQSLAVYLSHCSYVVRGGRVFVSRLIELINSLDSSRSVGIINELVRADLQWWLSFVVMFNGRARIIGGPKDEEIYFCTDASLSGFGATWDSDFLLGTWNFPGSQLNEFVLSYHWVDPPCYSMSKKISMFMKCGLVCSHKVGIKLAQQEGGPVYRQHASHVCSQYQQIHK